MIFLQVILIILIWAIPIFLFIKTYKRMDKKEQQDAKEELKNPLFLLIFGGGCIGFQVFITGSISEINIIQHIGAGLVTIGILTGCMALFKQRNAKKGLALMIVGIIGAILYINFGKGDEYDKRDFLYIANSDHFTISLYSKP